MIQSLNNEHNSIPFLPLPLDPTFTLTPPSIPTLTLTRFLPQQTQICHRLSRFRSLPKLPERRHRWYFAVTLLGFSQTAPPRISKIELDNELELYLKFKHLKLDYDLQLELKHLNLTKPDVSLYELFYFECHFFIPSCTPPMISALTFLRLFFRTHFSSGGTL